MAASIFSKWRWPSSRGLCSATCERVTLGDYVDRGPDSRQVIQRLMGGLDHKSWRLICLKGDHEDIMWQPLPWHRRIVRPSDQAQL